MKKSALYTTLLIVTIPILLVLLSTKFLRNYQTNPDFILYILYSELTIIFISAVVAYFIILKNVKQKVLDFKEIKSSNERFEIVAKATSDTIWDWKIESDTFEWNKGIQGIYGFKKEGIENSSKWWIDQIHPEDRLNFSVKLLQYAEKNIKRWTDEYKVICADKSVKYVLERGFLVKDKTGKAIRMIASLQDITKQKLEENRLKLLETVILKSEDSIVITEENQQDDENHKITFVNPAFTKISGVKPNDAFGQNTNEIFEKYISKKANVLTAKSFKNKENLHIESHTKKKNGKDFWLDYYLTPVKTEAGNLSHWISIQRNITGNKLKELEREHLISELTRNNNDLKQFSYITSHNLRAPLSNLTGLLNLMNDIEVENPILEELIKGFSSSTNLLNDTINDLVEILIIKDNKALLLEDIKLMDIFNNVSLQLSNIIKQNNPDFIIDFDEVPIINSNKTYLESIFINLLTNSIKYRSEKPLQINISSKIKNDKIKILFTDNGIGIDLERNKDKVFGLYQKFHNNPDSKGLGLYLVKSQVESLGGTIDVKSIVDKGTTFIITLKI